ncbi:MAG: BON domain-containing protein [Betaproteobacteria bacterium]|nr:BON domain-containing protein [Betaproteobacteria bacterium]MDH5349575.1 BON domain-containing protein [Betaproteobacteria bacterium]
MTSWRSAVAAAALALPLLQGCVEMAIIGGAGVAVATAEDRRTTATQMEDRGIQLRASNRIDDRYGDRVHVNVTVFSRHLLLTGEVGDEKTRADVEALARGVPNVAGVVNDVQIAGVSSTTSRSNDALITSAVKTRFADANKFNLFHVKVVTEAAVVYLLGVVTEQEAAAAVEIARTTSGVRKVVKVFEYCTPSDELCRPPK